MPASRSDNPLQGLPIPEKVRELCRRYQRAQLRAWLVGGCVRDLILGKSVQDWDLATDARPEQTMQLFRRVIPTGLQHGTVTVHFRGEAFEITTLRGEGAYSDGRRPDQVMFVEDIDEDLARRDFTVNAMAWDPLSERLIDPFGGRTDLAQRLLRAVGDPLERFREDGLRPLRGARFCATLNATLEADTEAAIAQTLDVFEKVSRERVREEWLKALAARAPSRAFQVMARTGLLSVCCPVLDATARRELASPTDSNAGFPSSTVTAFASSLCAVDHVRDRGLPHPASLAALFHALKNDLAATLASADRWLSDYRFSNQERRDVRELLSGGVDLSKPRTPQAVRRWLATVGRDAAPSVLDFQEALAESQLRQFQSLLGKGAGEPQADAKLELLRRFRHDALQQLESGCPLHTRELAVGGRELMEALGMAPGPELGVLLQALLEKALDDPSVNQRDTLLELALAARKESC